MPKVIPRKDYTNSKIGKLLVLKFDHMGSSSNQFYNCLCDCGKFVVRDIYYIKKRPMASCGCYRKPSILSLHDRKINQTYSRYVCRAKSKNIEWKLSKKEFSDIILANCAYCGEFSKIKNTGPVNISGIDRLNSYLGYIQNNVVSCCGQCNKSKMCLTEKEFLTLIRNIYEHRIKK